ncbi:MAG TPA: hypothetical protein VMV73_02645 [Candidatus Dormibacteraeota bacterium]|nr:hypothetical protein [Candidatus Dormibacteraeota bacterium]
MIGADLALALLINRTTLAYDANPPTYVTYRERTSIEVPSFKRQQEIDRSVAVRNADDLAVMHDLPQGARRVGQAFPIIPLFDPFSSFGFSYYANLKAIDITLTRSAPFTFPIPASDPQVDIVVPYASFWDPSYAPDSTPTALHFIIAPTSRDAGFYPSEVVEDPTTQLPSRIVLSDSSSDTRIALDYRVIAGHWVIVRGVFSATEHALGLSFFIRSTTIYDKFAFPALPPDATLSSSPTPQATPTLAPHGAT